MPAKNTISGKRSMQAKPLNALWRKRREEVMDEVILKVRS